jgi:hypothetical protein
MRRRNRRRKFGGWRRVRERLRLLVLRRLERHGLLMRRRVHELLRARCDLSGKVVLLLVLLLMLLLMLMLVLHDHGWGREDGDRASAALHLRELCGHARSLVLIRTRRLGQHCHSRVQGAMLLVLCLMLLNWLVWLMLLIRDRLRLAGGLHWQENVGRIGRVHKGALLVGIRGTEILLVLLLLLLNVMLLLLVKLLLLHHWLLLLYLRLPDRRLQHARLQLKLRCVHSWRLRNRLDGLDGANARVKRIGDGIVVDGTSSVENLRLNNLSCGKEAPKDDKKKLRNRHSPFEKTWFTRTSQRLWPASLVGNARVSAPGPRRPASGVHLPTMVVSPKSSGTSILASYSAKNGMQNE